MTKPMLGPNDRAVPLQGEGWPEPREGMQSTDTRIGRCTLRRDYQFGLFVGATVYGPDGWRIGTYRTQSGAMRAAVRHG